MLALIAGCTALGGKANRLTQTQPQVLQADPTPAADLTPADPSLAQVITNQPKTPRRTLDVFVTVLSVQIPRSTRAQAEPLWSHLREDIFDARVALRLQQNGIRAGIGHRQWWDAIKAQLDAVPDVRTIAPVPLRIPPSFPLALEMDEEPRDQTLFYLSDDGILTGETWPQSRNVLRLVYEPNLNDPERIRLRLVPEVRQRLDGFRYVRTPEGVAQAPQIEGRIFAAAEVVADLRPGEFLLVAPSASADLFGMVGGAFLGRVHDGVRYDSLMFLRADLNYVAHAD